jgi:hypothetical protein
MIAVPSFVVGNVVSTDYAGNDTVEVGPSIPGVWALVEACCSGCLASRSRSSFCYQVFGIAVSSPKCNSAA